MAIFSKKVMGKEVGDAKVYAPPHTMDGKAGVDIKNSGYNGGNRMKANDVNMSVGSISRNDYPCLLYTSPSPRDRQKSRMPSSA